MTEPINTGCATCSKKWFGNADKALTWAQWYCRKSAAVRRKDMPVIGNDQALRVAPGCAEWDAHRQEALGFGK